MFSTSPHLEAREYCTHFGAVDLLFVGHIYILENENWSFYVDRHGIILQK